MRAGTRRDESKSVKQRTARGMGKNRPHCDILKETSNYKIGGGGRRGRTETEVAPKIRELSGGGFFVELLRYDSYFP